MMHYTYILLFITIIHPTFLTLASNNREISFKNDKHYSYLTFIIIPFHTHIIPNGKWVGYRDFTCTLFILKVFEFTTIKYFFKCTSITTTTKLYETGNEWDTVEPVRRGTCVHYAVHKPLCAGMFKFKYLSAQWGSEGGSAPLPLFDYFYFKVFWPKHSNLSFFISLTL